MLTLPVNNRGSLIAISDDTIPNRVVVASAKPRLARRPDGSPLLRLDRWVLPTGSSSAAPVTGGRLNLTIDLEPLASEVSAANLGTVVIEPIPWLDATIELMGPLFQPVVAEIAVAAGALGVIAVDLTPEASSVLASLLVRDVVSPLQVVWTGSVRVRLPAVEIVASASVRKTASIFTGFTGRSSHHVSRSLIEANAHIEIRGANNPELEAVFREWALSELARRLDEGSDLSVRASAGQVVRWPIRLATTLDDLLSSDQRQNLVQTHVLDPSELSQVPPIEVSVLGAFGDQLERVDVRLAPTGDGSTKELSINSDKPQRVRLGTADFRWSYRTKLPSQLPGEWSQSREVKGSYSLLIPVSVTKDISIEVLASGVDFERRWKSISVQLNHQAALPDAASTVVELNAANRSAMWKLTLAKPRGKVRANITFFSHQGQSVKTDIDDVTGEQLIIVDPLESHRRRLALMPAGNGWDNIAVAMVDLRYRDRDFRYEETVELKSFTDFVEWETPVRADGPREIEWRCHASFRDGRFEETDWRVVDSTVLAVPLQAPASRQVQLVPVFFDSSQTARLEVKLRSGDRSVTQVITSKAAIWVTLPPGPFLWSVTWSMINGMTKQTSEERSDEEVIILPRHQ